MTPLLRRLPTLLLACIALASCTSSSPPSEPSRPAGTTGTTSGAPPGAASEPTPPQAMDPSLTPPPAPALASAAPVEVAAPVAAATPGAGSTGERPAPPPAGAGSPPAPAPGSTVPPPEPRPMPAEAHADWLVAREGRGFAEESDGQLVLHLRGTHFEMGYQMGKMFPSVCRDFVGAWLHDPAIAGGRTLSELLGMYSRAAPFLPQAFKDEMRGLAEGAGLPLNDVLACHMLPDLRPSRGSAAWSAATVAGRLYQQWSLSDVLEPGARPKARARAAVLLFEPADGTPHAVVGWVGMLGCASGVSARGLSVGAMASASRDESFAGIPSGFLLRQLLQSAATLREALDLLEKGPRTYGYNFIFADGKVPEAVAVEVNRSRVEVFRAEEPKEDILPHGALKHAVRRSNHFVSADLAATQRSSYDPRESDAASWMGYNQLGAYLEERMGRIDAEAMRGACRLFPPRHPCLQHAVFSPGDLKLWVAIAGDPALGDDAWAQHQRFTALDLGALLTKEPAGLQPRPASDPPAGAGGGSGKSGDKGVEKGADKRDAEEEGGKASGAAAPAVPVQPEPAQEGTYRSRALELGDDLGEELRAFVKRFDVPVQEFGWRLYRRAATERVEAFELRFPTPMPGPDVENNTVYADYYRPTLEGRHPAAIVLHHLGGDFGAEQMMARQMAAEGIASLMVWLPYYGKRQPADPARRPNVGVLAPDVAATVSAFVQGVCDVRRAGDWLASRPEVDPAHVGIMGVSLGSIVAALTAGVDPRRFGRVGLVVGGGDVAGIVLHARETKSLREALAAKGLSAEDLRSAWRVVEPLTYASRIDPAGVLMLNAKKDEVVPNECTQLLWEALRRPRIVWYEAGHYTIAMHFPDLLSKLIQHFKS
ncbi:MAG: alpha/beta hydrolase family protein [Planctomycetes bacterium]|nr:alpha/beta hydrolase family protein [Planctomycetota bacterium]